MKNIAAHFRFALRRIAIVAAFLAGVALPMASSHAADGFISGFDDLPLMPGMSELQGEQMTFDSPTGRIVENLTHGAVDPQAVIDFYSATLPQLGWAQTGSQLFTREDEILKLEFLPPKGISSSGQASGGSLLSVRFRLYPAEK